MNTRQPTYWRAFLITAVPIGIMNVGLFIYFLYLPEQPIGKGGRMVKPVPEWSLPLVVINAPGAVAALPLSNLRTAR